MAKLSANLARAVVLVVVVAIVVVGAIYLFGGSDTKKVTARFTAAVGIYTGTPVRQLGVNVGEVTGVKPHGGYVDVTMEYDSEHSLPADATAVEVTNSLVSDRYIQLSAYSGKGPKFPDGGTIALKRTSAPAELDDIYKALNTLSVALGPQGANKHGALSNLLRVGAANLKGNGAALGQSIEKLSQAATTLSDGRHDLFGTVTNLRKFTKALSDSDGEVRKFNSQLAQVARDLAAERSDLGAALKQLGLALDEVKAFVQKNAGKFHKDISGLRQITGVLVKQKASLNETLAVGPVALANIVHAYQPNLGVISTRSNLGSLTDPGQVCVVIDIATATLLKNGPLGNVLGPLTSTIVSTCQDLVKGHPKLVTGELKKLGEQLGRLLGGCLGTVVGIGGKC